MDIDTSVQQFFDILPPPDMSLRWCIGMSQFINQNQLWFSCQCSVEIEFPQCGSAVGNPQAGNLFQSLQQSFRFRAAVQFHIANHNINARRFFASCILQHCERLADPCGVPEVDLQPSTFSIRSLRFAFCLHTGQHLFRSRSVMIRHGARILSNIQSVWNPLKAVPVSISAISQRHPAIG